MKRLNAFFCFLAVSFMLSGCATAQKQAVSQSPDARDQQISALQNELKEQKVLTAEAEARSAKAENDLRELEMTKSAASSAKPKDPYLK